MTIKIMSAMPNALLAPKPNTTLTITEISEEQAKIKVAKNPWKSFVGHTSTAALFSDRLGVSIEYDRTEVEFALHDCLLVGLFVAPRRLKEGERWTETEILSMPIQWALVQWFLTECVQIVDSDYTVHPVDWWQESH